MSEEKVLTLRGKKAVWAPGGGSGPIDPKRLPEGYPYKEQGYNVLVEEHTLNSSDEAEGIFRFVDVTVVAALETITDADIQQGIMAGTFPVTFKWDGKYYDCKLKNGLFGNASIYGNGEDTGEPFVYSVDATSYGANAGGDHTVEVSIKSETIHPMAAEFLPALTSPNGTKYQLTVADDGTLSAVAVE